MKSTVFVLGIILLLAACAKRVWPSDVKPGADIEYAMEGAERTGKATVVRVDGDWLVIDGPGGEMKLPREKVVMIRVLK